MDAGAGDELHRKVVVFISLPTPGAAPLLADEFWDTSPMSWSLVSWEVS